MGSGASHNTLQVVATTASKHSVQYDDGCMEVVQLDSMNWHCLSPCTQTGGLTPALCAALRQLGAGNLQHEHSTCNSEPKLIEHTAMSPAVSAGSPTDPNSAVGRCVRIWCSPVQQWRSGCVLAYSAAGTGRHHILFHDGIDEWITFSGEVVTWEAQPIQTTSTTAMTHICALEGKSECVCSVADGLPD